MSLRKHVVRLNREVGYNFNRTMSGITDGIADGIEWIEPFLPWAAVAGIFLAVIVICFG